MTELRHYSLLENLCISADEMLKALTNSSKNTGRPSPAKSQIEESLSDTDRKMAAALMRVNHTGEVCAQALYQGQAVVAKSKTLVKEMQKAAVEEGDHLNWCKDRIVELGSHTSYLNPVWYTGSFVLGLTAGLIGDKWSLGFLAETETQVVNHLQSHLTKLPEKDAKSKLIVTQMITDELAHKNLAMEKGAAHLPSPIKELMRATAKIMTTVAYWI